VIDQKHVAELMGCTVYDQQGQKVGKVAQVYLDGTTDQPTWVTVQTGLFGTKESFVPLDRANLDGDGLRVPVTKDAVKDAPRVDADGALPPQEEDELYRYYRMGRMGTPQPRDTGQRSASSGNDAMTRSEERLNVGTRQTETGRVRLRKYVVTERVQTTVPVSHEEVRLEREPITEANRDRAMSGPDITESEHEVTLHGEEPVIDKHAEPVERVRLDKKRVTEQRPVGGEVRKEQIDIDESQAPGRPRQR
jgi:uncharacterized protein (TIGR02271 family)